MHLAERVSEKSFLRKCARIYEDLVERVLWLEGRCDDEQTLRWLGLAAGVAWAAHPGRFADERLEAVALRVGQRLRPLDPTSAAATTGPPGRGTARRRVLHVATTVFDTGGHTRLVENWIRNDPQSLHSLVLLDQREPVRRQLADLVTASGGNTIVVPAPWSLLQKAQGLRQMAQSGYDCVILHHHPHDAVPIVALASEKCPPVAVMNHADHVFWLGASVADVVISFREFGARLSRERRGARTVLTFPLPIDLKQGGLTQREARAQLLLSPTEVMLLSMGAAYKYRPTKTHDFFRTLHKVLDRNPIARLYIIGVSAEDLRSFGVPQHERVEPLGVLSDPSVHQAAADLYLEGFPYGGYTALIESAAQGVCPVLMYDPTPQLDCSGELALRGLVSSAAGEADYIERVSALIADMAARNQLAEAVAQRIGSVYDDIGGRYMEPIYACLATTKHLPAPPAERLYAEAEEDLNLASFNQTQIRTSILARGAAQALARLTLGDLLYAFALSVRLGDTRPTPRHLGTWLRLFRSKALPRSRRALR